ncbi:TetR/AcrR family transcriptional regulator [Nitriliruptor alkaliphilus]|uniref:TetR/AcrR family transcriptional regulator n=1 Tax=Nitriliruptor alkaliphilus TaxID=427918 RepID=UPI000696A258|nr:TetR/AcrR family transcriptional regulator [Nitriliruptor alkaliphilus]
MSSASRASAHRPTPIARADATRARLLDAAISCLVELGYTGTTTLEIQRRAGVSRGSLLHHYPLKDDLLSAAVQHLAANHLAYLKTRAAELLDSSPTIDEAVEFLWSTFDSDFYWATVELWVGSRTNSELRTALLPGELEFARSAGAVFAIVFGAEASAHPRFRELCELLLSSMRGVALTYSFDPRPHTSNSYVAMWKRLAHTYLTGEA